MSKTKPRKPQARRYGRVQAKKNWYDDLPLLAMVVGGILVVATIGLVVYLNLNQGPASGGAPINGINCQQNEQLAVHYHAHLAILVGGSPAAVPGQIGINNDAQCLYWLHTHTTDGVIHIEAPKSSAARKFTLGDFFDVWHKPLDSTHVGASVIGAGQKLIMFVDGKPYTGDPRQIVLGNHTLVTLEIGSPEVPPPSFTFPAGE